MDDNFDDYLQKIFTSTDDDLNVYIDSKTNIDNIDCQVTLTRKKVRFQQQVHTKYFPRYAESETLYQDEKCRIPYKRTGGLNRHILA